LRGRLASAFIGGAIANHRAKYMYQQQANDQLQEYKFQQQQEELERLRAQQQQQQAMYSQPQQSHLQGSSSNPEDIAKQLHKFAELHEKGALTDAEFQQLKSKLLMQM
jgi:predicted naringenin-chalcone synthase